MNEVIDKIYQSLEQEDELWVVLEKSENYYQANQRLQELNKQIKIILEEKLGKNGRTLLNDQEELYYKLLTISQRYFFEEGFKIGSNLNTKK